VGFGSEDFGCGGGWGDTEDGAVVEAEVGSGFGQHRGLPRTSRTNYQLETAISCNRSDCVLLTRGEMIDQVDFRTPPRTAFDAVLGSDEQFFLLVEDCPGGERVVDGWFGDRSAITPQRHMRWDRTGNVHAPILGEGFGHLIQSVDQVT
jgi:hypothetical protein